MDLQLFKHFLPAGLLDHFDIEYIEEVGDMETKKMVSRIGLTEKNVLPISLNPNDYESKGFYESKKVQDFPIRGKAVLPFDKNTALAQQN